MEKIIYPRMNIENIKEQLIEQFVDDYGVINSFMTDINRSLTEMHIDTLYDSYDEFCLDILENVTEELKKKKEVIITPMMMAKILNNMVKSRIVLDSEFEDKVAEYFEYPDLILEDLRNFCKK